MATKPIRLSEVENVVVRLPNWIGDAVMAVPAVTSLKKVRPSLIVTCLGKPAVNRLYKYSGYVDRLIDFELPSASSRLSGLKGFSRDLREYSFDMGLILPDSFSSALVFKLGAVGNRVGYRSELRSFLLHHPVRPPREKLHRSERYMELLRRSLGISSFPGDVAVIRSDLERQRADELLTGIRNLAVVCPTSRAPSRRWGDSKYAELISRLHGEMEMDIALAGGMEEADVVGKVGCLAGVPYLNLARHNDILLSVEILSRARVFIGNDSGAAHLAAAAGTRVVSISGADDPLETRPLAKIGAVVRKDLFCSPCVKNVCPRKEHVNECMDIVAVEDVMVAVRSILETD
jgi:heptosyltransferase-2